MDRFVISAPRSGLNWVRFCTEHFYGRRTPGKTSIIDEDVVDDVAFLRSHDPLSYTRKREIGAWQAIDPGAAEGGRVVLILRDPLELFVRMAKKRLHRFGLYAGNLRFFSLANTAKKEVFLYDDLITSPAEMMRLFDTLKLRPADGYIAPTLEELSAQWDEASDNSRRMYDRKQAVGGGSKTKNNPLDFNFHQRWLTEQQKMKVWRYLKRALTPEEFDFLARFEPPAQIPPTTLAQRVMDWV